jgi:hypothetical protein
MALSHEIVQRGPFWEEREKSSKFRLLRCRARDLGLFRVIAGARAGPIDTTPHPIGEIRGPLYARRIMPKPGLARAAVAVLAVWCSMHVDCASSSEVSTSAFPDAERMMSQARGPRADERGGFVLDTYRSTMTARVDGTPSIDIDTRLAHARIERVGAGVGRARLRGNVVHTSADVERFVFARGEEIEELALLPLRGSLDYRFVLPDRFRMRLLSPAMVQVDDAAGDPWLRMRADRAWSKDGRVIPLSLAIEGDVVRVVVPNDAPYPLLVDPIWASASSPTVVRELHTATLLGDGRVLIAGGYALATRNTAEVFDPKTGLFTALTQPMKAYHWRHVAITLPSGKVLLVGGNVTKPDAEFFDPQTNTFTATTNDSAMTGGINEAALLPDGKVLVKGYVQNTAGSASAAEIFDPTTQTFTPTKAGTLDARGTMVTLADGRVYLLGECGGEIYDPVSTNWTAVPTGFCSQPESRGAALMADGRVLTTGWVPCAASSDLCTTVQVFDPAGPTYSTPPPEQPGDGRGSTATLLPSGQVLVSGSWASTTASRIYDPTSDTFSSDGVTLSSHRGATATVLPGGDVLVVGGELNTADIRTFTGNIAPTPGTMVAARYAAATQRLKDGKVLIAGGSTHPPSAVGTTLSSAELYDPAAQAFAATTGTMSTPREYAITALLPSGKVLIAGGDEVATDAAKASAEVYDPSTKQFTAVGPMTAARTHATAARLPNGKILVTGGCSTVSACLQPLDATASRLASAETFDEATGTFTATNPMIIPRSEHGLVAMPDGRVLVVGTQGQASSNVETYDPGTGSFRISQSLYMPSDTFGRSALLLSNGKVFVGGGFQGPSLITDATVASPTWTVAAGIGFGLWTAQYVPTLGGQQLLLVGGVKPAGNGLDDATAAESRIVLYQTLVAQNAATVIADPGASAARRDVATALVDHGILVAGGDSGYGGTLGSVTNTAYVHSDGASDARRPVLTSGPNTIAGGTVAPLTGQRLTTVAGDTPIAFWQPAGTSTFVPTRITSFSATSAEWTAPVTALHGLGWLHVVTNGIASNSLLVEVGPAEKSTACKYDAECTTGFCVEGVCCDTACGGGLLCQSCTSRRKGSGADGTCGAVVPGEDPDKKCVLDNGGACTTKEACKSGFCVEGVCCNGDCIGSCRTCTTGICKETPTCGDAAPPAPAPPRGPTCDGDHLVKEDGKPDIDCTPYKCNGSACRTECASANDCVAPTICSFTGQCIAPPNVRPSNESLFGCASTPARPSGSRASWQALGVLFAMIAALRRRGRGR